MNTRAYQERTNYASQTANRALKRGQIERGTECAECGVSGERLEMAHFDYSKPLEVTWLCRPCHVRLDLGWHQPKEVS